MNLAALISDPTIPIPDHTSKRVRAQVQTLRDAYRTAMASKVVGVKLATPEAVSALMAPLIAGHSVESLWAIPLNPRSEGISEPIRCSQGGPAGTDADVAVILRAVLIAGATSYILVHNHPTGNPQPSSADVECTRRAVMGGATVNVPLVDHVVIGDAGRFASIRRDRPEVFR